MIWQIKYKKLNELEIKKMSCIFHVIIKKEEQKLLH